MLEIAVCDDDIADLECAVNMLHKIFTSQKIAYHIEKFMSAHSRSAISSSQTAISSILFTFFLSSYYIGNFYLSIK